MAEYQKYTIEELLHLLTEVAEQDYGKFSYKKYEKMAEIKKEIMDRYQIVSFNPDSMIGKKLNDWFCNGFFGSETEVWLEGAEIISTTYDTVTVRQEDGKIQTAEFDGGWRESMKSLLEEWTK